MANCPWLWPLFKSLSLPFKTSLLQDDTHGLFLLPFPNKATRRKQRLNRHIPEWRKPRDTGVIEHTAEISKSQPQTPAGSLRAYSEKVFKKPSIRNVKSKSPCSSSVCKRGLKTDPTCLRSTNPMGWMEDKVVRASSQGSICSPSPGCWKTPSHGLSS